MRPVRGLLVVVAGLVPLRAAASPEAEAAWAVALALLSKGMEKVGKPRAFLAWEPAYQHALESGKPIAAWIGIVNEIEENKRPEWVHVRLADGQAVREWLKITESPALVLLRPSNGGLLVIDRQYKSMFRNGIRTQPPQPVPWTPNPRQFTLCPT